MSFPSPWAPLCAVAPDKIAGPIREMLAADGRSVGAVPFTVPPLTAPELTSELASINRHLHILIRRRAQVEKELA